MIVTMSRYSTTSASSAEPAVARNHERAAFLFSAGTVSSMMRLSAAMTPLMPPPSSGRMTGYTVVVKTSPVLDDVGAAEEHEAVAVGVRRRLVQDLRRLRR